MLITQIEAQSTVKAYGDSSKTSTNQQQEKPQQKHQYYSTHFCWCSIFSAFSQVEKICRPWSDFMVKDLNKISLRKSSTWNACWKYGKYFVEPDPYATILVGQFYMHGILNKAMQLRAVLTSV
jgi:hypothetical protein